ncbi:hypothetical protein F2Q70_00024739 [Brassica cretica]|uniref:ELYS-like domain-containing protein n=1 Tax=Brassica cretica TaxID=69181 RepID=A0A8S9LDR5_BRACR|nr:hypothetical protein F2Q70_00024739 [Brassica cretica]
MERPRVRLHSGKNLHNRNTSTSERRQRPDGWQRTNEKQGGERGSSGAGRALTRRRTPETNFTLLLRSRKSRWRRENVLLCNPPRDKRESTRAQVKAHPYNHTAHNNILTRRSNRNIPDPSKERLEKRNSVFTVFPPEEKLIREREINGSASAARSLSLPKQPDYSSKLVQVFFLYTYSRFRRFCVFVKLDPSLREALMHLASCGRSASYVLIPCGHASLCTECSQMCDVCPICRSSLLRTGDRLRLYYECVEAGLISEEDEDEDEHQLAADVHRLYSLFDVAMNNSLISVVCDYITKVCMDETAVSSDSVIAFLLDEVVVKDWGTFLSILAELQHIYSLETKEMQAWLDNLLKYSKQVSGICSVIEVMESAFKGSVSPQLEDVQKLRENIGKTKQHLDIFDMVHKKLISGRCEFMYYLFDRHWTTPEKYWKHIIDDFAATFGITRHSLPESFVFYLLDDPSEEALEEACKTLPEICGPETYPKVAQVLLERENHETALMVLRWTLCLKVKEHKLKNGAEKHVSDDPDSWSWKEWMKILVNEFCCLSIRRNVVDRIIELPWNPDEEKYLHRCLLDSATDDPSSAVGSLLVVFYLQRYRYIQAYQVDFRLQKIEEAVVSENQIGEEAMIRMLSQSRWRKELVREINGSASAARSLSLPKQPNYSSKLVQVFFLYTYSRFRRFCVSVKLNPSLRCLDLLLKFITLLATGGVDALGELSSLPRTGDRLRLRLYYDCVEAGLISRTHDEEDEDEDEHQNWQLMFIVFILYITKVCMDETAVSSDPVIAFLLNEVVVKDWVKRTFLSILAELQHIYSLETKEMQAWLDNLLKYSKQVTSICSVLEVMESALKGSVSPQLEDVEKLRENIGKTKQAS